MFNSVVVAMLREVVICGGDNLPGLGVWVTMVEYKKEKRKVRWLGSDLYFRVKLQFVWRQCNITASSQ
jgi:hypothetical protein